MTTLKMATAQGNGEVYQNWCGCCCGTFHPLMLTGYCLAQRFDDVIWHCDNCGRADDLAMVKVEQQTASAPRDATAPQQHERSE